MQLSTSGTTISIQGNIKSIQDFQEIKSAIDRLKELDTSIHFDFSDSISITSSVIGYITTIIHNDGIDVFMLVDDQRLYDLLNELQLIALFHVKKR